MAGQLDGKVAIVTGAAGGIGAAIVRRFVAEGARVAAIDSRKCEIGTARFVADLADDRATAGAVRQAREALGRVDLLVHAAAASVPGGVLDTPARDFQHLYDVNVVGAVRLIQALAPTMDEGSSIILLSSINARFATPTLAAYAASKAALESLARTAACELAPRGIRVNAIAPASIDTPLLRGSFERADDPAAAEAANRRRHPLARLGTPEEVAALALFLASEAAGWITGSVYAIDGGAGVTRQ